MATSGVPGNGVLVAYSASSPVDYTLVPQLLDVKLPTFVTDQIDVTTHSLTNKLKRKMSGLSDVTDMELILLADLDETTTPAHAELFDLNQTGAQLWWRIEVPVQRDRTKCKAYEFQGNVGSFEPSAPINGRQEIRVMVRFDGDTFTQYPAGSYTLNS